jgi:hypothetical protein
MYSEKIVFRNLVEFATREGWTPQYHTYEEVREFSAYIDSLTKVESNTKTSYISVVKPITAQRQKDIAHWIVNEQALCGLDSNYWETRYAWVCDEKGQIFKFQNRKSQDVFDSIITEFDEKQVSIELLVLKARQVGLCLDPETKVLTADLQWKRIDDLKTGEEIVAIDEGQTMEQRRAAQTKTAGERQRGIRRKRPEHNKNAERKMRTARLEAKWDVFEPAIRLTFEDGRQLTATPEHRFLIKQRGGTDPRWQLTKNIGIGDELRYVTSPWTESDLEDAWIGGVLDGEGSLNTSKDGIEIKFTQVFNGVLDRIRDYVIARRYNFQEGVDRRQPDPKRPSKLGKKDVARISIARMDEVFRLIGQTRPVRFVGNRWWEGKSLPGKRSGIGWSKVIKTELLPERRMIDIQTSTKTFIAEGFVSHNSTKVALKFIHRLMFIPHTQAVMASVMKEKSELIGRILDTAYNRSPWWLVPRRMPKRSFDNGSILSIQSGMQATGLAQGWTPTCVHVSELADVPNPKVTIEEGLFRAAHSSRNLFMVLEGTGGGNTGWLADTWRASKADWPKGLARLFPMFIPWPMCPDIYPEPDWVRKFPVPVDFESRQMHEITRKHVIKCESYIRNTPYLAKIAGANWRMPPEQKWFWQFNYDAACKNRTQKTWAAQMPADDYEALTGIHDSVFDPEVLMEIEDRIYVETDEFKRQRKQLVEVFAVTGHDVDEAFYPPEDRIDWSKDAVRVEWDSYRGQHYEWNMIPLLDMDEENERNTLDYLLVYEWPVRGQRYSCGVDTADGLGKEGEERTCLSVARNRFMGQCDQQVAELTSNRINSAQVVAFAACVGALYGPYCPDARGMKYCIEQTQGPGDTCQHQLKMMGFFNHHIPRRYDSKKIKDDSPRKEGWYSSAWSVPMLMTRFVEAVNGGWYEPRSKWLIEELRTLERHETAGKSKMTHQQGKFDDRVRAAAQSYFTAHDMDVLTERAQKRYALPQQKRPQDYKAACTASQVSVGSW